MNNVIGIRPDQAAQFVDKQRSTLRARAALLGLQLRIADDDEHGEVFAIGPRRFTTAEALEAWLDAQGAP